MSVIAPAPAFTVTAPAPAACVSAPVCVSAPFDCSARVPVPTVTVPSASAFASRSDTAFAPVLARLTAPTKSFATLLSVIAPAPAFTVTAPAPAACVIAPVCVSAPFDWIASVPLPTFTVPSASAFVSRSDTLFAPLLVSVPAR